MPKLQQHYNVILADNHLLAQKGLISILGNLELFANIDVACNKDDLTKKISTNKYNLLITDYEYFDFNEITELSEITQQSQHTRILIITDNKSRENILKLKELGISNYILKNFDLDELSSAISATLNGKKYYPEEILDILLEQPVTQKHKEKINLTVSEIEIVKLIAQGLTTKEIANKKFLSLHTIITHRKNIFRKVGVNSTSELIMYAIRNGIVDTLEYYI